MSRTSTSTHSLFSLDSRKLRSSLLELVERPDFPCVGAKSALARGTLEAQPAWRIDSGWDDVQIHRRLLDWSEQYQRGPGDFRSLAVVFSGPEQLSEVEFERAMWDRLQSLADKDGWLGHPYDERVSSDPNDPHFSLSFGKQAYFVVGMHPSASRLARRSQYPTLVFNLHDQFERLRAENRYQRMRERILARDEKLAGSINPMLAQHGETNEARQYSGRQVSEDWKCPFKDKRTA